MKLRIPRRFDRATLDSLDAKQFSELSKYISKRSRYWPDGIGVLISGPPGVGKTWAVAAMTRFVVDASPRDHEFVTAPDLFDRLGVIERENPTAFDDWREQLWMTTYRTVPWLVINDLGKEYRGGKLSEQANYKFGRVLRARSESELLTHLTTNFSLQEIKDTYGDSIASLLSEMTIPIIVQGEDRRRAG